MQTNYSPVTINLPLEQNSSSFSQFSGECAINNMYVEQSKNDDSISHALISIAGQKELLRLEGNTGVIHLQRIEEEFLAVTEVGVYLINSDFTKADLILQQKCSNKTSIANNGQIVMIVNNGSLYQWNNTTKEMTQRYILDLYNVPNEERPDIINISYQQVLDVCFISQVFIILGEEAMYVIDVGSLRFRQTDFATTNRWRNKIVSVANLNQQLWIFGEESIEAWFATDGEGFPYQPTGDISFDRGCPNKNTVQVYNNTIFWLSENGEVWAANDRTTGGAISDSFIGHIPEQEIQNALSYCYTENHHDFYVLVFNNISLAYDMGTDLWHTRQSNDHRHIVKSCATRRTRVITGHSSEAIIMEQSSQFPNELGNPIKKTIDFPLIHSDQQFLRLYEFIVEIRRRGGEGPLKLGISYRKNGSEHYSRERIKEIYISNDDRRVVFRNLGQFRTLAVKLNIYSDGFISIGRAYAQVVR